MLQVHLWRWLGPLCGVVGVLIAFLVSARGVRLFLPFTPCQHKRTLSR